MKGLKNKQFIALTLILTMILSMFTGIVAHAESEAKQVSIRIEGIYDTIVDEGCYLTKKETVYDAVYELLEEEGISVIATDSSYGKFVSSIRGETAGAFGGYEGWMYLVNGASPYDSIDVCTIDDGDEIVLYFGEFDTYIPKIELLSDSIEALDEFTVKISSSYDEYDGWDYVGTKEINIEGAEIKFGDEYYVTDENGEATIIAPGIPGNYSLKISKDRKNNYPLLVRTSVDITIKEATVSTPEKQLSKSFNYIYNGLENPKYGSEWSIIALTRGNQKVSKDYYKNYYDSIVTKLKEKNGDIGNCSEYSKLILALTAIGKDVTDVGGYNLLERLADYNRVTAQGVIGTSYALLALDSYDYDIPIVEGLECNTSRDNLIKFILDKEINKSLKDAKGWALSGTNPDVDVTSYALQALAPYYDGDEDVEGVTDRAIAWLSENQTSNGGYPGTPWAPINSQNISQAIVALTELGIDPHADSRFIKDDNSLIKALMEFAIPTGGFKNATIETKVNAMATEQGTYALAAYKRFKDGKASLYDMTDVKIDKTKPGLPDEKDDNGENGNGSGTGGSGSSGSGGTHSKNYATISIDRLTINGGYVLNPTKVELKSGDSVWSLTKREMDIRDIPYDYSGSESLYIKSIDDTGEFDYGPTSGWMYSLNGKFSLDGSNQKKLKDGDIIKWRYTTNLGEDLGEDNSEWDETSSGGTGSNNEAPAKISEELPDDGEDFEKELIEAIDLETKYQDYNHISSWAMDSIKKATKLGFIEGSDGRLNPKANISRAEFIKVMAAVLNLDIKIDNVIEFKDVKGEEWFYPYINAAFKAGIIEGSGSKFNPKDGITREQMAVIIARALRLKPEKPTTTVTDIDKVSSWAKAEVETIVALGLMVGNENIFDPLALATKEMAVVLAIRIYDYLKLYGAA